MKNISVIFSCFFIMTTFFLPASVWSGTFTDNFNSGNVNSWEIQANGESKWVIEKGGYKGSIATGTESIAITGEPNWEVQSIEVKIRDTQGEWLAIVFHYQDISNFDAWWLNMQTKAMEAWPKIGDYEGSARTSVPVGFDPAKESTIGVEIKGDSFDALFNGKVVGTYTNDKFKAGKVGLLVWNSTVTFDDVVIDGANVSNPMTISPESKLPVLWGTMKK